MIMARGFGSVVCTGFYLDGSSRYGDLQRIVGFIREHKGVGVSRPRLVSRRQTKRKGCGNGQKVIFDGDCHALTGAAGFGLHDLAVRGGW